MAGEGGKYIEKKVSQEMRKLLINYIANSQAKKECTIGEIDFNKKKATLPDGSIVDVTLIGDVTQPHALVCPQSSVAHKSETIKCNVDGKKVNYSEALQGTDSEGNPAYKTKSGRKIKEQKDDPFRIGSGFISLNPTFYNHNGKLNYLVSIGSSETDVYTRASGDWLLDKRIDLNWSIFLDVKLAGTVVTYASIIDGSYSFLASSLYEETGHPFPSIIFPPIEVPDGKLYGPHSMVINLTDPTVSVVDGTFVPCEGRVEYQYTKCNSPAPTSGDYSSNPDNQGIFDLFPYISANLQDGQRVSIPSNTSQNIAHTGGFFGSFYPDDSAPYGINLWIGTSLRSSAERYSYHSLNSVNYIINGTFTNKTRFTESPLNTDPHYDGFFTNENLPPSGDCTIRTVNYNFTDLLIVGDFNTENTGSYTWTLTTDFQLNPLIEFNDSQSITSNYWGPDLSDSNFESADKQITLKNSEVQWNNFLIDKIMTSPIISSSTNIKTTQIHQENSDEYSGIAEWTDRFSITPGVPITSKWRQVYGIDIGLGTGIGKGVFQTQLPNLLTPGIMQADAVYLKPSLTFNKQIKSHKYPTIRTVTPDTNISFVSLFGQTGAGTYATFPMFTVPKFNVGGEPTLSNDRITSLTLPTLTNLYPTDYSYNVTYLQESWSPSVGFPTDTFDYRDTLGKTITTINLSIYAAAPNNGNSINQPYCGSSTGGNPSYPNISIAGGAGTPTIPNVIPISSSSSSTFTSLIDQPYYALLVDKDQNIINQAESKLLHTTQLGISGMWIFGRSFVHYPGLSPTMGSALFTIVLYLQMNQNIFALPVSSGGYTYPDDPDNPDPGFTKEIIVPHLEQYIVDTSIQDVAVSFGYHPADFINVNALKPFFNFSNFADPIRGQDPDNLKAFLIKNLKFTNKKVYIFDEKTATAIPDTLFPQLSGIRTVSITPIIPLTKRS